MLKSIYRPSDARPLNALIIVHVCIISEICVLILLKYVVSYIEYILYYTIYYTIFNIMNYPYREYIYIYIYINICKEYIYIYIYIIYIYYSICNAINVVIIKAKYNH